MTRLTKTEFVALAFVATAVLFFAARAWKNRPTAREGELPHTFVPEGRWKLKALACQGGGWRGEDLNARQVQPGLMRVGYVHHGHRREETVQYFEPGKADSVCTFVFESELIPDDLRTQMRLVDVGVKVPLAQPGCTAPALRPERQLRFARVGEELRMRFDAASSALLCREGGELTYSLTAD